MFDLNMCSVKLVREDHPGYNQVVTCSDEVYDYVNEHLGLADRAEEYVYMLSLNAKSEIVGIHEIAHGTLTEAAVCPREVFKNAVLNNAIGLILLHNHPSGDATPSTEDYGLTRRIKKCGELMGIPLQDHIVIGANTYESIRELTDDWDELD